MVNAIRHSLFAIHHLGSSLDMPAATGRAQRWYILALLFFATAISYIDRQVLAVVAPVLRDELGISNSEYARIVFSFLLAYTVMQAATGWLVDRLGTRNGLAVLMVWWSTAAMLHAFGRGVLSFAIFRFLLGVGQAGSWAASVRAVSEWFPQTRRAFANSVWGTGVSVGSAVAVPLVAGISIAYGWRHAFVVTGAAGFVWTGLWPAGYRRPAPAEAASVDGAVAADVPIPYWSLLGSRNVWALVLARVFADPVVWFYSAWVPEFLARTAGFSMADIGRYAWIPFVAYGAGILLGGMLSDLLCRSGRAVVSARLIVMRAGVLFMTAGVAAAIPVHIAVTLGAISLAVLGFGLWAPNMMTLCSETAPGGRVGSVTGLSGVGAGVGGMISTLLTGWALDHVGYAPIFVAAGVSPLLAFAILYFVLDTAQLPTPQLQTPK
jgi:MFS transporter, ACS family, hexuronate transporter